MGDTLLGQLNLSLAYDKICKKNEDVLQFRAHFRRKVSGIKLSNEPKRALKAAKDKGR